MNSTQKSKYLPLIKGSSNPEIFWKRFCCIYFLMYRKKIVYIGQTGCLHQRITAHKPRTDIKFDSFRYIECKEKDMIMYERRWINKFLSVRIKSQYIRNEFNDLKIGQKSMITGNAAKYPHQTIYQFNKRTDKTLVLINEGGKYYAKRIV